MAEHELTVSLPNVRGHVADDRFLTSVYLFGEMLGLKGRLWTTREKQRLFDQKFERGLERQAALEWLRQYMPRFVEDLRA